MHQEIIKTMLNLSKEALILEIKKFEVHRKKLIFGTEDSKICSQKFPGWSCFKFPDEKIIWETLFGIKFLDTRY